MFNENHDLTQEFPQYKDKIHNLKICDAHFHRLFESYHIVHKQLQRIAQQIETTSDMTTESLKKQRLLLKDALLKIIHQQTT